MATAKVDDVKAGLITTRRIIFTPDVDLEEENENTGGIRLRKSPPVVMLTGISFVGI